jgi:hypothetical protein
MSDPDAALSSFATQRHRSPSAVLGAVRASISRASSRGDGLIMWLANGRPQDPATSSVGISRATAAGG